MLTIGAALLFVAAVFQLFDGLQGVRPGCCAASATPGRRCCGTSRPLVIGLPLGYVLCFRLGFGVVGLWWGLSTGLIICGVALVIVWMEQAGEARLAATIG